MIPRQTLTYEMGKTTLSFTKKDGRLYVAWNYQQALLLMQYAGLTASDEDNIPTSDEVDVGPELALQLVKARKTYLESQKAAAEVAIADLELAIADLASMESSLEPQEVPAN